MSEREDGRAGEGRDGWVGAMAAQQALQVLRIEIEVEVLRNLEERRGGQLVEAFPTPPCDPTIETGATGDGDPTTPPPPLFRRKGLPVSRGGPGPTGSSLGWPPPPHRRLFPCHSPGTVQLTQGHPHPAKTEGVWAQQQSTFLSFSQPRHKEPSDHNST